MTSDICEAKLKQIVVRSKSRFTSDDIKFVSEKSNHILFDKTIENITNGQIYVATVDSEICGLSYSVPHHIIVIPDEDRKISIADSSVDELVRVNSLTDELTHKIFYPIILISDFIVDSSKFCNRDYSSKIIESMIHGLIQINNKRNILTGYYFTSSSYTKTSIKVNTWYRPIDVKSANECKYQIPIEKSRILDEKDILKYITEKYENWNEIKDKMKIRPTEREDFRQLRRRKRRIHLSDPSRDEWKYLSNEPLNWITFSYDHQVKGIACIRDLVTVFDTNKVTNAELVFFEPIDDRYTKDMYLNLFKYLNKRKYTCIYGIFMGALSNENMTTGFIECEVKYLNFYGFESNVNRDEISILYL